MAKPTRNLAYPDRDAPPPVETRLSWPDEKDVAKTPRKFRIQRLSAYEWQAYVTVESGKELPIGKPDLFDLVKNRVAGAMRMEGQVEFMEAKKGKNAPV